MRGISVVLIAACWAALAGAAATARAAGDPKAARGLIAEHCTSCHSVPGYKARWQRADLNAPPFERIARDPEAYPPERLRAFLGKPHWPMTRFVLSPRDIDNILAFIGGLR